MTIIADSFVSLAALVGLLMVMAHLRRRDRASAGRAPMTWRFLFALGILVLLLASRVLDWASGFAFFDRLSVLAAGLVPLGALVVMEGLMRRHAPVWLKWYVAFNSLVIVLMAMALPETYWNDGVTRALFGYQLIAFLGIGVDVVRRDRSALSVAENVALDRIALSLVIILPVLVTDYRGIVDLPVRLGGVAMLFLAWLAVTLGRPRGAHGDAVASFAVLIAAALVASATLAAMFGLGVAGFVQAAAIVLSATMLGVLWTDIRTSRRNRRRLHRDLVEVLAAADTRDVERFLFDLRDHPSVADARVLRADDLSELDLDALAHAFDVLPVRRADGGAGNEQVDWLLSRHEATHAFRVRRHPIMLVVLRLAGVATSEEQEAELRLVQRFAEVVARAQRS